MMLVPASGTIRSQDNCNASFNYERPTELETNYYLWEINRDEYASLRLQLLELALGASGLLDVKEEAEWLSYYAR